MSDQEKTCGNCGNGRVWQLACDKMQSFPLSICKACSEWIERQEDGEATRRTCTNMSTYADCDLFTCSNCGQSHVVQRVDYDIDAYYTIDEAFGNDDADMCDADLRYCPSCGHEVVDEPCSS